MRNIVLICAALALILAACGGQNLEQNIARDVQQNIAQDVERDAPDAAEDAPAEPPEEAGAVWRSDDGKLSGTLKDAASSEDLCLLITRSGEGGQGEPLELKLPTLVKSVESVSFPQEDRAVVISHVNPSLELYQVYDLETEDAVEEYWGCGFLLYEDVLYYVQAPQHFSGVRGNDRILTSHGDLLYESGENVTIDAELSIDGDTVTFYERDLASGETVCKTCSASGALRSGDVSYY